MLPKSTPETPAAIQARLAHLRNRKRVVDELIRCLEQYRVYQLPLEPARRKSAKPWMETRDGRLAGAA
jgi:hypothetical protein